MTQWRTDQLAFLLTCSKWAHSTFLSAPQDLPERRSISSSIGEK